MKIKINQEACIGCGSCQAVCPDCFELNQENKAIVKEEAVEQCGCVQEAVDICPVQAIEKEE